MERAFFEHPRFAENVMHFVRVLRRAGLPVGPAQAIEAVKAVEIVGVRKRGDFYSALHACLVTRHEQNEMFDQAFHIFWRNPKILERMMGLLLPQMEAGEREPEKSRYANRLAEAMFQAPARADAPENAPESDEVEIEATLTWSDRELIQKQDFETMTGAELAEAKRLIARMRLPIKAYPTRRFAPSPTGSRIDLRASLKASLRSGGDIIPLKRTRPKVKHPPLVVLCDISGSMERYSRVFLHFLHAVTNDRDRVSTFLFGTKLSNITRQLKDRDVDVALAKVGTLVEDWAGGTRIGAALHDFNRHWARRVLGQGAVVLFISDGLDRDDATQLSKEMDRLHRSCRRLIWLNPLLRWDGFEPKATGIKAIMPHIDEFRPVHNLQSLADIASALGRDGGSGQYDAARWKKRAEAA